MHLRQRCAERVDDVYVRVRPALHAGRHAEAFEDRDRRTQTDMPLERGAAEIEASSIDGQRHVIVAGYARRAQGGVGPEARSVDDLAAQAEARVGVAERVLVSEREYRCATDVRLHVTADRLGAGGQVHLIGGDAPRRPHDLDAAAAYEQAVHRPVTVARRRPLGGVRGAPPEIEPHRRRLDVHAPRREAPPEERTDARPHDDTRHKSSVSPSAGAASCTRSSTTRPDGHTRTSPRLAVAPSSAIACSIARAIRSRAQRVRTRTAATRTMITRVPARIPRARATRPSTLRCRRRMRTEQVQHAYPSRPVRHVGFAPSPARRLHHGGPA